MPMHACVEVRAGRTSRVGHAPGSRNAQALRCIAVCAQGDSMGSGGCMRLGCRLKSNPLALCVWISGQASMHPLPCPVSPPPPPPGELGCRSLPPICGPTHLAAGSPMSAEDRLRGQRPAHRATPHACKDTRTHHGLVARRMPTRACHRLSACLGKLEAVFPALLCPPPSPPARRPPGTAGVRSSPALCWRAPAAPRGGGTRGHHRP